MFLLIYDGDWRKQKYPKRIVFNTEQEVNDWIDKQCIEHNLTRGTSTISAGFIRLEMPAGTPTTWRWSGNFYYNVFKFELGQSF